MVPTLDWPNQTNQPTEHSHNDISRLVSRTLLCALCVCVCVVVIMYALHIFHEVNLFRIIFFSFSTKYVVLSFFFS